MRRRRGACAWIALGLLLAARAAGAALPYTFTKFADTNDDAFTAFGVPTLSPTGGMVWWAMRSDPAEAGYFGGNGTSVATVVTESDGFGLPPSTASRLEAIVFFPALDGIWRSSGAGVPPLQVSSNPCLGSPICTVSYFDPRTSDGISVAYSGFTSHPISDVSFVDVASPAGPVGLVSAFAVFGDFASPPAVNDVGQIAVVARSWSSGGGGLGNAVYVFDSSFHASARLASPHTSGKPSLNDAGTAAVVHAPPGAGPPSEIGIYTSTGGAPARIAAASTGFAPGTVFSKPAITDSGLVVFRAVSPSGVVGLYAGPDPVAHEILETGDPFQGSTLTDLHFDEAGLNDAGQIAFFAEFADGTSGVYRADPPHAIPHAGVLLPDPVVGDFEPLELDATVSLSLEEPISLYEWDLDGDGSFDLESEQPTLEVPPAIHLQYLAPGENFARLRIRVPSGLYSIAPFSIFRPTACSDGFDGDQDGAVDHPADAGCRDPFGDFSEEPDCADGLDNDEDGATDWPLDPGCASADAAIENPACDDGFDGDGDGRIDLLPDRADPGCEAAYSVIENPKCDDDIDNDGDGKVDHDGGLFGGDPDPECTKPWKNREAPAACGVGAELAVLLAALWLRGVAPVGSPCRRD